MFSGLSTNLATHLREELFGCMKYMKMQYDQLLKMATKDRKYFIKKHNEVTQEENSKYSKTESVGGYAVNNIADIAMQKGRGQTRK